MYLYPGLGIARGIAVLSTYLYVLRLYKYVLGMYLYIPVFSSEPSFTGCQGVLRDANMLVPDVQQPPADPDICRGNKGDPCPEDEDFFDRPDAATMEEAISGFMDGIEAQESGGFKDVNGLLGHILICTGTYLVCTFSYQVRTWSIL